MITIARCLARRLSRTSSAALPFARAARLELTVKPALCGLPVCQPADFAIPLCAVKHMWMAMSVVCIT